MDAPVYVDDTREPRVADLYRTARASATAEGTSLVVVDSLGGLQSRPEAAVRALRQLAIDKQIAVLLVAHSTGSAPRRRPTPPASPRPPSS